MQTEILPTIIQEMEIEDILRISLVYPELFEESMWRRLCGDVLGCDWDYYSFLPEMSKRRKFAKIAVRKSFLPAPTPEGKVCFAILNQRRDLLKVLCRKYPGEARKVCRAMSQEGNIYFNRPLVNFALTCLGHMLLDREKAIANFSFGRAESLSLTDQIRMYNLTGGESVHDVCLKEFGMDGKALLEEKLLEEYSRDLFYLIYSMTREKDILDKMIDRFREFDLSPSNKRNILCNLYRGNFLDLALKHENKYQVQLDVCTLLSCLADYYLNSGDDRGLYLSLLQLEERGVLLAGSYHSKIFILQLEEVNMILERNKIVCGLSSLQTKPLLFC